VSGLGCPDELSGLAASSGKSVIVVGLDIDGI
jgi:hypothetical protein